VPDLGKANMPYSRSVQQSHPLPGRAMPDAGLLFDTLLRRDHVSVPFPIFFVWAVFLGRGFGIGFFFLSNWNHLVQETPGWVV
jgi:hypothetical protein